MTLRVNAELEIPDDELVWRFTPSGGPGGQHANRSATRVELAWSVAESAALSEGQRALLLTRLGPWARAAADDERSQLRNRGLAAQRLAARVAAALQVEPPRRATKPTRGSQVRRVEAKRRRSELKRGRGWRGDE
ncbi:MAG: alternative ribosome rescue aminoacyl-tRNA hydrolase ArfB [Acidimicrobiales bacterium]